MEGGNMFEEIECFDPNAPAEITVESGFSPAEPPPSVTVARSTSNSNCTLEDLSEFHLSPQDCSLAAVHQLHHINITPSCDHQTLMHQSFQDPVYAPQSNNWENSYQDFVNLGPNHTTPDLLSLLQLPRSSLPPFSNPSLQDIIMTSSSASAAFDPLFHLNFPLQSLGVEAHNEVNELNNLIYAEENNNHQNGLNRKGRGSRKRKVFPTERERTVHFKDRFGDLRNLIPNPSKNDRASIVGEAVDHIKELLRTIEEFKMLVEKKRIMKQKNKRARNEEEGDDVVDENCKEQNEVMENCLVNKNNSALRCSWLKRKTKFTEVDVRIIDDEVTIKIVQKKKINCLMFVSKVIDQLQLDLHYVAGAQIREHHSFLFNNKICEGSSVYASGIANRVMEVLEKQYMEALSTNSTGYHSYSSD